MTGNQYLEMYQRSIDDPAGFWSEIAETFYWKQKWSPEEVCTENLDVTKGPIKIEVSTCLSVFDFGASLFVMGGQSVDERCWCFGSGLKGAKLTYATMPWTATWRPGTVRRLPCIGRGMSLIRMGSSHTQSSWIRFAR